MSQYLNDSRKAGLGNGSAPSTYINRFYRYGNIWQTEKLWADFRNNPLCVFPFTSRGNRISLYPIDMLPSNALSFYKTLIAISKLNNTSIDEQSISKQSELEIKR